MKRAENAEYAFNRQLIPVSFLTFIMAFIAYAAFREGDIVPGIFALLIAMLGGFVFAVSPMYFVFDSQRLVIRYLFGLQETVEWRYVNCINRDGSWGRYGRMPCYQIAYFTTQKRYFFMHGEVARTSRTKKLMKRYYRKGIN